MLPPRQWYDRVTTLPHVDVMDALTGYFASLRSQQHCELFFLTFTYKAAPDKPLTFATMSGAFTAIYIELLRRYVHPINFARPKYRPLQPIVFAFPDSPQSKRKRAAPTSRGIIGLHHHAIVAARSEVAARLDHACSTNSLTCLSRIILTSDLQRIGPTQDDVHKVVDYATSYAFKHLPEADVDHRLLVYPAVERWKQAPPQTGTSPQQYRASTQKCPPHPCSVLSQECRPSTHSQPHDRHARAKLLASCVAVRGSECRLTSAGVRSA